MSSIFGSSSEAARQRGSRNKLGWALDWDEKVYKADILTNREKLYKKPGYNDFA